MSAVNDYEKGRKEEELKSLDSLDRLVRQPSQVEAYMNV